MSPFDTGFVEKMIRGIIKDFNTSHADHVVHPELMQSLTKRIARQVYQEARKRGLPHPDEQEFRPYEFRKSPRKRSGRGRKG